MHPVESVATIQTAWFVFIYMSIYVASNIDSNSVIKVFGKIFIVTAR
jgi:hypothetical protein